MGQYELKAVVGERIRIDEWLPDNPYPQASIRPWPDEPGPPVTPERIGEVVDRILALFERIVSSRGAQLRSDALAVEPEIADDPSRHIYALASRVPMGQADRYAVLAAPTLAERVDVLDRCAGNRCGDGGIPDRRGAVADRSALGRVDERGVGHHFHIGRRALVVVHQLRRVDGLDLPAAVGQPLRHVGPR